MAEICLDSCPLKGAVWSCALDDEVCVHVCVCACVCGWVGRSA
jgi:hypothetical protein